MRAAPALPSTFPAGRRVWRRPLSHWGLRWNSGARNGSSQHGKHGGASSVYVPNIITVTRLFLVPVIIWLIVADKPFTAFVVFLVAGLTDAVDGFLARRFGWQTELGAYLDAIADKALLI